MTLKCNDQNGILAYYLLLGEITVNLPMVWPKITLPNRDLKIVNLST